MLTALNKFGISFLKREFRRGARRFLAQFTNSVLSTVAARSEIGQGMNCFCPTIFIGWDKHAPLHLFGLLLDGFLEKGRIKGSDNDVCGTEYQSLVLEQRQLERYSRSIRPHVDDCLSFCSLQVGSRARQHLFRVCIMINEVRPCDYPSRKLIVFSSKCSS